MDAQPHAASDARDPLKDYFKKYINWFTKL